MRIQLINPPNSGRSIPEETYGNTSMKLVFRGEPLSLETLAGNLDGHDTHLTDLKAAPDDLLDDLRAFRPDLVAITGMTCEANAVVSLATIVKREAGALVVVGGHHASCDPGYFNRGEIDYVVAGLGKASFRELVDALSAGEPNRPIPGVGKTRKEGLTLVPRAYGEADLVDDRAPRYDLVARHRSHYVMSGVGGTPIGFVASAHGCTHRCAFCAIPNMTGGRYLTHSTEAVIRDIRLLESVPLLRLVDANTFGDPPGARRLGERILEEGFGKKFVADVRSDTVVRHPELFDLWKRAGLAAAVIGFEEISDDRLKDLDKKNRVAVNLEAMTILKSLGIRIIGDFIVSPDYVHEDFQRLRDFVAASPIDLPVPSVLTPIPGTPLYARMKDRITVHDLDYYTFINAVVTTRLPEREFYEAYSSLLNDFLHPAHRDA